VLCLQHQGDAVAAAAALDAVIRPQVGTALKLLAAADEQQQQQEVRDNTFCLASVSVEFAEHQQWNRYEHDSCGWCSFPESC
jgi:hypothetical protein